MAEHVKILNAVRFVLNEEANLCWVDVVELERKDGTQETWSRALRRKNYADPDGKFLIWDRSRGSFLANVAGRREFENRTGHLTEEIRLQTCTTLELGPSRWAERETM